MHAACMVKMRNVCRICQGKPEGKRPLQRHGDGINMYLKQTEYQCVDWIHVAQNRIELWAW